MLRGAVSQVVRLSFWLQSRSSTCGRASAAQDGISSVGLTTPRAAQRRGTSPGRAGLPPHRMQGGHEATKQAPASDHDLHLGTPAYSQHCARYTDTGHAGVLAPSRQDRYGDHRRRRRRRHNGSAAKRLDGPRRGAAAFAARGGAARRAEERSASVRRSRGSRPPSRRPNQLASAARMRSAVAARSSSLAGRARRKSRSCSPSIGTRCR